MGKCMRCDMQKMYLIFKNKEKLEKEKKENNTETVKSDDKKVVNHKKKND